MKRAAFYTLGCKVNQYETEALTGLFEKEGYQTVDFSEIADVYVINTCTVTGLSDRKSRQMIRRARGANKDAIIVVAGCYSQTSPGEVSSIPGVDLVIGTGQRERIVEYVRQVEQERKQVVVVGDIMKEKSFEKLKLDTYKGRTRAFLKIQEGCTQFCSYCIIPYARGPVRSREPEDVMGEVEKLAEAGFKEIVLTGIHLASYGRDLKTTSLLDILKRINPISGIERIRIGSVEPTLLTEEFVKDAAQLDKLCPHFHVSLQSGCDATLKRMNRRYTTAEYREVVLRLREYIPDVSVTTDVMVGFPGETEEEFGETCRFLREIALAKMHVFKYSPRKGTPAAVMPGQVTPEIKEKRSKVLLDLSDTLTEEFNRRFIGRTLPVLLEEELKDEAGMLEGLTPNYIRTLCAAGSEYKGKIADVKILRTEQDYARGEIIFCGK